MSASTHATVLNSEMARDALAELGNVAFSHAATALSSLVGKRVDLSIPGVSVVTATEVEDLLAKEREALYIITLRILGDQQGVLALVFPESDALALTDMLEGAPVGTRTRHTPASEAVLGEVANIMSGSALLAMYRLLRISLIHGTPVLRVRSLQRIERSDILLWMDSGMSIVVDAAFSVADRTAHGQMYISFSDLRFFSDALAMYAEGGA